MRIWKRKFVPENLNTAGSCAIGDYVIETFINKRCSVSAIENIDKIATKSFGSIHFWSWTKFVKKTFIGFTNWVEKRNRFHFFDFSIEAITMSRFVLRLHQCFNVERLYNEQIQFVYAKTVVANWFDIVEIALYRLLVSVCLILFCYALKWTNCAVQVFCSICGNRTWISQQHVSYETFIFT